LLFLFFLLQRDASAAAVTASALFELGEHVAKHDFAYAEAFRYWTKAERILTTLSSSQYRAKLGEASNFLLLHSVGNYPSRTEVDVPLVYADYYYIEAMTRYKRLFMDN
jgi:hypothetical protein